MERTTKMLVGILIFAVVGFIYFLFSGSDSASHMVADHSLVAAVKSIVSPDPTELGWLDDAAFSEADKSRVAALAGRSQGDNLSVIRSMQAGVSSNVSRRDFELMRQDRRRAFAAYPECDHEKMTYGAWVQVDLDARVPDKWGGGNSSGTMEGGIWYLDGGTYQSLVKPEYTRRASAEQTREYYATKKIAERKARLERLEKDGPNAGWSGSGGSLYVRMDEHRNIVVQSAKEWSRKATKWTFPFVPEEWADITYYGDLEIIKKLPSFAKATSETVAVEPSGVSISSGTTMTIMPGQTVTMGVQGIPQ